MVEVFLNRGYKVVSGGTENHLFLLDLVDKNLTGKEADAALGRGNITLTMVEYSGDIGWEYTLVGIAAFYCRVGPPQEMARRGVT
ncbi:serine hydroxymethyltransferase, partial [Klebsiella pneumoniae]|nr:serine hydroxymethyltransferase [Klebsiella pneumoniae]